MGGGAAGCNRGRSQWGTRSSVHASCGRFVGSCRRLEPGCDHWRDGVRKVSNQRADGLVKEASVQWPVVRKALDVVKRAALLAVRLPTRLYELVSDVHTAVARRCVVRHARQPDQGPIVRVGRTVATAEHVLAHLELTAVNEHWPLDVLLDDVAIAAGHVLLDQRPRRAVEKRC